MLNLNLQKNEYVVLTKSYIRYNNKITFKEYGLVLTNLNLIVIEKGFFGSKRVFSKIPLNTIKKINGKPSIVIHNDHNMLISCSTGEEMFGFYDKSEAVKWIKQISDIVEGFEVDFEELNKNKIPIVEKAANLIKDTVDTFFGVLFPKKKKIIECKYCSAQLLGRKGNNVKCPFCGKYNKI